VDVVRQGGIEWMAAGSGIWHRAQPVSSDPQTQTLQAFQIWFALPPSHEPISGS
jgi:redox-sensitive bicupin YhaK (pirin superfamily)